MTDAALQLLEQLRHQYIESEYPHWQVWNFQPGEENKTKIFHELRAHGCLEQIGAHGSAWRLTAKGHSWILRRLTLSEEAQKMLKWIKEQLMANDYRPFTFMPHPATRKIINELSGHEYIEQTGAYGSPWQLTITGQQKVLTIPVADEKEDGKIVTDELSQTSNTERTTTPRASIFISYCHKDKKFFDALLLHLKPLERAGFITTWSDEKIVPGAKWMDEIKNALACAKVAVMMVSPAFLASEFINDHELGPLLEKADKEGVRILWIPVRACVVKETPLSRYQAVIPHSKPLAEMKAERDKALVEICEAIKKAVTN